MTVVQRSPTAGIHGTQIRHSRDGGNPRRGPAMGSPLHRNDGGRRRTHNSHSRDGGNPQRGAGDGVPLSTGTTDGGGAPHNRHSRDGGNPQRGAGDGFPSPPERRWAAAHHNRHSRDGGNPQRGPGDGFPSPPQRRWAAGAHTIVIPATAGIHRGGPAMGSRLHRNDGGRRRTHNRHSRDGGNPHRGPAMGSRLHGNDGGRRRTHNRHPRDGGNPQRGATFLSAAPNRYRGGRGRARRRTCDTMTSAGIDRRSTRRRPAAPTLVGSMQPAAQRTCQS